VFWKNNRIITGSIGGTVRVWDNDLNLQRQIEVSKLGIVSVVTNGYDFACTSLDGKLKLYDNETGELKKELTFGCGNVWQLRWHPESNILAYSNGNNIGRISLDSEESFSVLSGSDSFSTSLAYSPDGNYLASGFKDGSIAIFESSTVNLVTTIKEAHLSPIRCLAFFNNNTIYSGGDDKAINIFDISSGSRLGALTGHSSWIYSISCSPKRNLIASCSADKTIKIWSTSDNTLLSTLYQHTGQVMGVEWSAFGDYLVSVGEDKAIIIYKCISK